MVGRCVVAAADRLNSLGDFERRWAAGCSLKEHVLKEMGEPGLLVAFVAASCADIDGDRGRARVRHLGGDDPQAVRTDRSFVHVRWIVGPTSGGGDCDREFGRLENGGWCVKVRLCERMEVQ